jgi:WD40 repeat protein
VGDHGKRQLERLGDQLNSGFWLPFRDQDDRILLVMRMLTALLLIGLVVDVALLFVGELLLFGIDPVQQHVALGAPLFVAGLLMGVWLLVLAVNRAERSPQQPGVTPDRKLVGEVGVPSASRPPLPTVRTATLTGHRGKVRAVGFGPDGRLLATGSTGGDVVLWDVTDPAHPARIATLTVGRRWLGIPRCAVGFSPDGRLLAAGAADGGVVLWDVTDPAHPTSTAALTVRRSRRLEPSKHAVAFSPDGRLLAAGSGHSDARVILWDVTDPTQPAPTATLTVGRRWRAPSAYAVGFRPDGRLLATGSSDGTAILWDVTDPAQPARTATLTHRRVSNKQRWADRLDDEPTVYAVGFSVDGSLLASGSADGTVALWDITDPTQPAWTATLTHHRGVRAAGFSPDGRLLAICGDNSVTLWRRSP